MLEENRGKRKEERKGRDRSDVEGSDVHDVDFVATFTTLTSGAESLTAALSARCCVTIAPLPSMLLFAFSLVGEEWCTALLRSCSFRATSRSLSMPTSLWSKVCSKMLVEDVLVEGVG